MNEWEQFCCNVKPLHKKDINNYIPKQKINPKKRYYINSSLDLHGNTIQESFEKVNQYVEDFKAQEVKSATIITGKSGKIKEEFLYWAENFNVKIIPKNEGSFLIKRKK